MKYFVKNKIDPYIVDASVVVRGGLYKVKYLTEGDYLPPRETSVYAYCKGGFRQLAPPEKITPYNVIDTLKGAIIGNIYIYFFI